MLRGLWKDISGSVANVHIRAHDNNIVTTASTMRVPEQQRPFTWLMLWAEACSGAIAGLSHVRAERCFADCLAKASAACKNLVDSVMSGNMKN